METNENSVVKNAPAALTPANLALAHQIIDQVFAVELDDALPTLEKQFSELDDAQRAALEPLMQALWNHFKAVEMLRGADFAPASDGFHEAAKTFGALGFDNLRDLAVGMGAYAAAVVMLRQLNVGQALEYFARVKSYLESAGKFSTRFQVLIDHMEPDALVVAGVQALMRLDTANGKILLDKAAQASEKLAQKYYANDRKMTDTFNGLAQFYRAYYVLIQAWNDLTQFAFDKFSTDSDLSELAKSAGALLNNGDQNNQNVKNTLLLSRGIEAMLNAVQQLGELMQKVFGATFKVDLKVLNGIRKNVVTAQSYFSQAGPDAVTMVRYCDYLSRQVNNLERLARPNKKDFGVFSGVISCALFLPIFLLVSWGKSHFGVELQGANLLWTCVGLALIGGFGFGALKFKSFFSSLSGAATEKTPTKNS